MEDVIEKSNDGMRNSSESNLSGVEFMQPDFFESFVKYYVNDVRVDSSSRNGNLWPSTIKPVDEEALDNPMIHEVSEPVPKDVKARWDIAIPSNQDQRMRAITFMNAIVDIERQLENRKNPITFKTQKEEDEYSQKYKNRRKIAEDFYDTHQELVGNVLNSLVEKST